MVILAKRIKEVNKTYWQKSEMLYPLLDIKKSIYRPINTYLAIEGTSTIDDKYLVVEWDTEVKRVYLETLIECPLYSSLFEHNNRVYTVFDMQEYGKDWGWFVQAKYSRISDDSKRLIMNYYTESPKDIWIESYLYPEYYQPQYHRLLDVNLQLLKIVGQLCDPPCIERETLKLE